MKLRYPFTMEFRGHIRAWRRVAGLTKEEVADRMGMPHYLYRLAESHLLQFSTKGGKAFCKAVGISFRLYDETRKQCYLDWVRRHPEVKPEDGGGR